MSQITHKQIEYNLHNNYPYIELLTEYTGANNKCVFYCKKCQHQWSTIARYVIKQGCPHCTKLHRYNKLVESRFLKYFNKHLKNDFTFIKCIDYLHIITKCNKCGYIRNTSFNNYKKYGCSNCGHMVGAEKQIKSNIQFIKDAQSIHGNKYDYSLVKYKNYHTEIPIICPQHGVFYMTPSKHLSGQNCPKCCVSSGEEIVSLILDNLKINYEIQKDIQNPYHNHNFKVDFYFVLNQQRYIIEYNGAQHYMPIKYFGGQVQFNKQIQRDCDLRKYCKCNNILLLEISYLEKDVKTLILNFLNVPSI